MKVNPIEDIGNAVEKVGDAFDKNITSKEEILTKSNESTSNARELQKVAYEQEDKFSKRGVFYLAFFWSGIAALYMFAASFFEVPEANQHIVNTIIGFLLGTIIGGIITFFYGSSYGSSQKTKQTDGLLNRVFNKNKD